MRKFFDGNGIFILWGFFIVLTLVLGTIQLQEAIKCGNKGGVYLTGKSVWPVCLKAETL